MSKTDKITLKEQEFLNLILNNKLSGKDAYKKLHPKASDSTCEVNASKILRKTQIKKYLKAHQEKLQEKFEIKEEKVLKELSHSAFSDPISIFDKEGCVKPIHEIPEHMRRAIASIEVEENYEWDNEKKEKKLVGYIKKIKLWDKIKSNERIQRQLGFEKPIEHKVDTEIKVTFINNIPNLPKARKSGN